MAQGNLNNAMRDLKSTVEKWCGSKRCGGSKEHAKMRTLRA